MRKYICLLILLFCTTCQALFIEPQPYVRYDSFTSDVYTLDTAGITLTAGTMAANKVNAGAAGTVSGAYSAHFGDGGTASGTDSVHFGNAGTASAQQTACFGQLGDANGTYATHFGFNGTASGSASTHFGHAGTASGLDSTHFGNAGTASGRHSAHFGSSGTASAWNATHFGLGNLADCYGVLTLGRYSAATDGNPSQFIGTDPILVIGAGANPGTRSTVLTIYKNGNITGTDIDVNTGTGDYISTGTLGAGVITGTSLTDGTLTITGGNISGADVDISAGTGDYSSSGILGAGAITGTSLTDGTATLDDGSLTSAVNGTFSGTVQAEQLTSTDDITMSGHLLTLGNNTANDVVVEFDGSAHNGTMTFDESAGDFWLGCRALIIKQTDESYGLQINATGGGRACRWFSSAGTVSLRSDETFQITTEDGINLLVRSGNDLYFRLNNANDEIYFRDSANATMMQIAEATGAVNIANTLRIGSLVAPTVALDVTGAALISSTLDVVGNIDPTSYETTRGGFKDEDNMASDSATVVASQQSIKAYVDTGNTAIYAQLSDSTDQTFGATGTSQSITFDTNDEVAGITHSIPDSNITIDTTGVYNIVVQPQVAAGAGATDDYFHMWLQKDTGGGFADISNSNVELTLSTNDEDVILLNAIVSLNAGDIIRVRSSVGHTNIELDAQTPASEPAIPSVIFSMFMIGGG